MFIKYCVFSLKFCDFPELCSFCCSASVLPAWCVYTHWHQGKTLKDQSPEYSKIFGKNTIFNEHPVLPVTWMCWPCTAGQMMSCQRLGHLANQYQSSNQSFNKFILTLPQPDGMWVLPSHKIGDAGRKEVVYRDYPAWKDAKREKNWGVSEDLGVMQMLPRIEKKDPQRYCKGCFMEKHK